MHNELEDFSLFDKKTDRFEETVDNHPVITCLLLTVVLVGLYWAFSVALS